MLNQPYTNWMRGSSVFGMTPPTDIEPFSAMAVTLTGMLSKAWCGREDLNLHGCYPTRS
jgi:hypothetical protein